MITGEPVAGKNGTAGSGRGPLEKDLITGTSPAAYRYYAKTARFKSQIGKVIMSSRLPGCAVAWPPPAPSGSKHCIASVGVPDCCEALPASRAQRVGGGHSGGAQRG